jgi:hypothetical protein
VWSEIGSVFITGGDGENFLSSSKEIWDTYHVELKQYSWELPQVHHAE